MATKAKDKKEIRKGGRGSHPNSRANLKPAQPGEVRNPSGKPEGTKDRATVIRKWVETPAEVTNPVTKAKERGTVEDLIVIAQVSQAVKGNTAAFKELMDSIYGRLTEKLQVNNYDFSKLTNEEIIEFDRLLSKLNS